MTSAHVHFSTSGNWRTLESKQWFARRRDEVFPFFADPRNLESITPPMLRFAIVSRGGLEMHAGLRIDYRLQLHGWKLRWQSEITRWEPPHRFVDEQRRGPYRAWIHEHVFEEQDGGTLVTDRVRYLVPGGAVLDRLFVRWNLRRIFLYRRRELEEILA